MASKHLKRCSASLVVRETQPRPQGDTSSRPHSLGGHHKESPPKQKQCRAEIGPLVPVGRSPRCSHCGQQHGGAPSNSPALPWNPPLPGCNRKGWGRDLKGYLCTDGQGGTSPRRKDSPCPPTRWTSTRCSLTALVGRGP